MANIKQITLTIDFDKKGTPSFNVSSKADRRGGMPTQTEIYETLAPLLKSYADNIEKCMGEIKRIDQVIAEQEQIRNDLLSKI